MAWCFGQAPSHNISLNEFWNLTPFAFNLIIEAKNKEKEQEFELVKYAVWHIAAFNRIKKLPKYETYLRPRTETPSTGVDETSIKQALKAYQNGKNRKP